MITIFTFLGQYREYFEGQSKEDTPVFPSRKEGEEEKERLEMERSEGKRGCPSRQVYLAPKTQKNAESKSDRESKDLKNLELLPEQ